MRVRPGGQPERWVSLAGDNRTTGPFASRLDAFGRAVVDWVGERAAGHCECEGARGGADLSLRAVPAGCSAAGAAG
eukprot:2908360-Pyramimonas_sp.AAC.1